MKPFLKKSVKLFTEAAKHEKEKEMLEEFKKYLTNLGYSHSTIRGYLGDIHNCLKRGVLDNCFNLKNANLLLESGLSAASMRRYTASIKKLFKFKGMSNPLEHLSLPRIKNKLPKIVDKKGVFSLLSSELPSEILAAISILYSTGCRIETLINIKVKDVKENEIIFHIAKGGRPYTAILAESTKKVIQNYMKTTKRADIKNDYLFCKNNGNKLSTSALRMRMKRAMGENYINPHAFRHSAATELIANGAALIDVSSFLNHASISTTQRYIHLSTELKRKRLKNYHPML